jgi:hypothetical protein
VDKSNCLEPLIADLYGSVEEAAGSPKPLVPRIETRVWPNGEKTSDSESIGSVLLEPRAAVVGRRDHVRRQRFFRATDRTQSNQAHAAEMSEHFEHTCVTQL